LVSGSRNDHRWLRRWVRGGPASVQLTGRDWCLFFAGGTFGSNTLVKLKVWIDEVRESASLARSDGSTLILFSRIPTLSVGTGLMSPLLFSLFPILLIVGYALWRTPVLWPAAAARRSRKGIS
jgi:hypothetical protein